MSSVLKKAQNGFENSLDRISLADVVGEICRASAVNVFFIKYVLIISTV